MDTTNKLSTFINEDIAYFLGLVIGRGVIIRNNDSSKLTIDFPYKNLITQSPIDENKKYDTHLHISNSVDGIVSRLRNLGLRVDKQSEENKCITLVIEFKNNDLSFQFIKYLINGDHIDYHSFRIPKAIFLSDKEIKKEFIRGYFDVTGHIRKSNCAYGQNNQNRVYLEVDHRNWYLVLDLVKLLNKISIPIQSIDFGHPNFRDPDSVKKSGFWAKEHQVKIYANQFIKIGSYIKHKQETLKEFAGLNRQNIGNEIGNYRITAKPEHPEENSDKLPSYIKGFHFDHYSQLLKRLERADDIKNYE